MQLSVLLHAQFKPSPVESGEHAHGQRIINRLGLLHSRDILRRESRKRIMPLSSITHENKVRSNALLNIDRIETLDQLARPSLDSQIILRQCPASAEIAILDAMLAVALRLWD